MKFLKFIVVVISAAVASVLTVCVLVFLVGIDAVTVYFAWQWFVAEQSWLPVIPFWTVFGAIFIYRRLMRTYKEHDNLSTKESWLMIMEKAAVFGELWLIKIIFL